MCSSDLLATYNAEQAMACARKGQALCDLIERLGKPVIAAINGLALGGGCEIAMACTVRIASAAAKLGQPEVKLGVIPGYGGSQRLPRLIGRGRAMEMILGGEPISAETAAQWGLVNRVVPAEQLLACALELAGKIVANSSSAVALAMQAVNDRLLRLWSLPHGFVKMAKAAGAATKVTLEGGVVYVTAPLPAPLMGTARAALNTTDAIELTMDSGEKYQIGYMIDRIETRMGATVTTTTFSDYGDWNEADYKSDVWLPKRLVETRGGTTTMDLTVDKTNTDRKSTRLNSSH